MALALRFSFSRALVVRADDCLAESEIARRIWSVNVIDEKNLIFPVGQRFGIHYASDDPEDFVYQVRVGVKVLELSADAHSIWELAHGAPDGLTDDIWSVERVIEAAATQGVNDAAGAVGGLIDDHAAVIVGLEEHLEFGRRHRMVPTVLGLGNRQDDPSAFRVGLLGVPMFTVGAVLYDIYEWACLEPDLWTACQNAAAINSRPTTAEPVITEAALLLGALVDHLHGFLAGGTAYLDHARTEKQRAPESR